MSKNTRTTVRPSATVESATVRMYDGTKWDTYKRGGKKHRAAEARRAAWEATRPSKEDLARKAAERQLGNAKTAAWMRSEGIQPSGRAWTECSKGERDVKVLRTLNAEDGLKPVTDAVRKAAKAQFKALMSGASVLEARAIKPASTKPASKPAKATKAPKAAKVERTEVVAEVVTEPEVEAKPAKAERKAAKRRSKAARKAYATRVANGTAVRVNGKFVKAGTTVQIAAPVDTDESWVEPLRMAGFSEEEIDRVRALRNA